MLCFDIYMFACNIFNYEANTNNKHMRWFSFSTLYYVVMAMDAERREEGTGTCYQYSSKLNERLLYLFSHVD